MKTESDLRDRRIRPMLAIGFAVTMLFVGVQTAEAQWTASPSPSPNNIYYNAGNVGIGTTSPAQQLEVAGGVRISGAATLSATMGAGTFSYDHPVMREFIGDGTGYSRVFSKRASSNTTDLVAFLDTGKVGIGTTSPAGMLDVRDGNIVLTDTDVAHGVTDFGDSTNSFAKFAPLSGTAGGLAIWALSDTGSDGAYRLIAVIGSSDPTDSVPAIDLRGYKKNSGDIQALGSLETVLQIQNATTPMLTALGNGNVGIGTTSPGQKLEVNGTISATNVIAKYQDVAEWVPASAKLSPGTVVVLDSTKSNQVTSSSVSYDTRVAGVISEQPGIALGEKSDTKVLVATTGRVRVKVDASKGAIHIGDLLVTSDIPGFAMKSEPVNLGGVQLHRPGTLIGKALEPLEKGKGEILVLLSLQ